MAEFRAATTGKDRTRRHAFNGAALLSVIEIPDWDFSLGENEVYLSELRAYEPRNGHGTQAMKLLVSLADMHRVDIVLHASTPDRDDDAPDDDVLIKFYKRFGFFKCGPNNMMVRPAQSAVAAPSP